MSNAAKGNIPDSAGTQDKRRGATERQCTWASYEHTLENGVFTTRVDKLSE